MGRPQGAQDKGKRKGRGDPTTATKLSREENRAAAAAKTRADAATAKAASKQAFIASIMRTNSSSSASTSSSSSSSASSSSAAPASYRASDLCELRPVAFGTGAMGEFQRDDDGATEIQVQRASFPGDRDAPSLLGAASGQDPEQQADDESDVFHDAVADQEPDVVAELNDDEQNKGASHGFGHQQVFLRAVHSRLRLEVGGKGHELLDLWACVLWWWELSNNKNHFDV